MSQTEVTRFFQPKKRGIEEDSAFNSKTKKICLERTQSTATIQFTDPINSKTKVVNPTIELNGDANNEVPSSPAPATNLSSMRQEITSQRMTRARRKASQDSVDGSITASPKIVNFFKRGNLSPQKKPKILKEVIKEEPEIVSKPTVEDPAVEKTDNETTMVTPTKQRIPIQDPRNSPIIDAAQRLKSRLNSMTAEEIKKKLKKSTKLADLKTSLNKLQNGLDRLDRSYNEEFKMIPANRSDSDGSAKSLKTFKNIELEVISPRKDLSSPIKLNATPSKNYLMSSPKILTPRKLFSPLKPGEAPISSPLKTPAFQRLQSLAEKGTPLLQLPFKHRVLLEVFKAVDTICAMYFNRKEKITFKKLKPAVQRMLRKNFYEKHLAQIVKLFPNAFEFYQEKTRNFGSTSKADYYQLVIVPNTNYNEATKPSDTSLRYVSMSPQMLIERGQKFQNLLLEKIHDEHEKFLQTLETPMNVTRRVLKRWHPEFDLEACPEIELGDLPKPPYEAKYSSAQDVLSAARNLFNCSTPMERAIERLEAKKLEEKSTEVPGTPQTLDSSSAKTPAAEKGNKSDALLKGVPKSLIERIRLKQAARALDTMMRNPIHEKEIQKYKILPDLARHVRNVYVTEKKGILLMEIVLKKIQNSYRGGLNIKDTEEHLRLIAREMPQWLTFCEIRKEMYIRMARDIELSQVTSKLDEIANEKAKLIST